MSKQLSKRRNIAKVSSVFTGHSGPLVTPGLTLMTLPNSTTQWCTKKNSDEICQENLSGSEFLYSNKCFSIIRFFLVFFRHVKNWSYYWIPRRVCHMFERLRYRVNVKGQLIKNSFIHHSFEAINDFL